MPKTGVAQVIGITIIRVIFQIKYVVGVWVMFDINYEV